MRRYIIFSLLIAGCSTATVTSAEKPTGEEALDLLLMSSSLSLKHEPLCEQESITRKSESLTLGQHLATNLSVSYKTINEVKVKSSCLKSKHDLSDSQTIDVWDCKFEVLESDKNGNFISSSMIAFSADIEKTKVIPGSIRCF